MFQKKKPYETESKTAKNTLRGGTSAPESPKKRGFGPMRFITRSSRKYYRFQTVARSGRFYGQCFYAGNGPEALMDNNRGEKKRKPITWSLSLEEKHTWNMHANNM